MSVEEKAINLLRSADIDEATGEVQWHTWYKGIDKDIKKAFDVAIKALEQDQDEVILTKEEYGELVSSEFDNGYTKGYTEALEQNDVLDKIRADIEDLDVFYDNDYFSRNKDAMFKSKEILAIIDKYKESEKINCKTTKCENCKNHNYCDFEPQESEDKE